MNRKEIAILIGFNLFIAVSFFLADYGLGYSSLSSDQHNIVPMCQKLDDPSLYQNDLFLSSVDNFQYYTPFFIHPLRLMGKLTEGNYVLALNILNSFTHVVYGLTWFVLFFSLFRRNFWIAFLLSILIRGVVWLPGMEIWGISGIWTFVPRSVYSALLPIPFIFLFSHNRYRLYISALLIGLFFNFHPISGMGGILIYLFCLAVLFYGAKNKDLVSYKRILMALFCIAIGMVPFVITYFSRTAAVAHYDVNLYKMAFDARIPSYFKSVSAYAAKWLHFKTLFFTIPLVLLCCLSFYFREYKKKSFLLLFLALLLFLLPLLSIPLENWINATFHLNLRMSFQLVRIQKLAILPGYLAMGYILILCVERGLLSKRILVGLTICYLAIILLATPNRFHSIPFISDDITTYIYPNGGFFASPNEKQTDFDKMAVFIEHHTRQNSVFYQDYRIRAASRRSVKFDSKGASILIEGNPQRLIEWYKAKTLIKGLSERKRISFLKAHGVTHIISKKDIPNTLLVKQIGDQKLYMISD